MTALQCPCNPVQPSSPPVPGCHEQTGKIPPQDHVQEEDIPSQDHAQAWGMFPQDHAQGEDNHPQDHARREDIPPQDQAQSWNMATQDYEWVEDLVPPDSKYVSYGTLLIEDQKSDICRQLKFGLFSFSYCGCAEIAVLNLLFLKDALTTYTQTEQATRTAQVEQIKQGCCAVSTLERHGAVLWGLLGTSSLALIRCLTQMRFQCQAVVSPDTAKLEQLEAATKAVTYIVTAWNRRQHPFKGIHTFLVEKIASGEYRTHNTIAGKSIFPSLYEAACLYHCNESENPAGKVSHPVSLENPAGKVNHPVSLEDPAGKVNHPVSLEDPGGKMNQPVSPEGQTRIIDSPVSPEDQARQTIQSARLMNQSEKNNMADPIIVISVVW